MTCMVIHFSQRFSFLFPRRPEKEAWKRICNFFSAVIATLYMCPCRFGDVFAISKQDISALLFQHTKGFCRCSDVFCNALSKMSQHCVTFRMIIVLLFRLFFCTHTWISQQHPTLHPLISVDCTLVCSEILFAVFAMMSQQPHLLTHPVLVQISECDLQ